MGPTTDMSAETEPIVLTVDIDAPPESVWQLLTDPPRIADWWGDHVSLEARPGGRFLERWTDPAGRSVVTQGEVVRLAAPRELELTWADDDWPAQTRVRFVLEEAGNATRLTLTHDGWEGIPALRREELVREHAAGWSRHLDRLATLAAGGAAGR